MITYDNLRYLESSWFLQEIKLVITNIFIDDGEFLIASDNEHATAEGKNKNLNILFMVMKNYPLSNPIYLFFSKLP